MTARQPARNTPGDTHTFSMSEGADGLARDFRRLEKRWKPTQKERFLRGGN